MIQAHELMIGNKLYRNGIVVTINGRSIFDIWDKSEEYSPIPLTPEILVKSGFVIKHSSIDVYGKPFSRYKLKNITIFFRDGLLESISVSETKIKDFKYVHQLQNLYFALTGKQLEITF